MKMAFSDLFFTDTITITNTMFLAISISRQKHLAFT